MLLLRTIQIAEIDPRERDNALQIAEMRRFGPESGHSVAAGNESYVSHTNEPSTVH